MPRKQRTTEDENAAATRHYPVLVSVRRRGSECRLRTAQTHPESIREAKNAARRQLSGLKKGNKGLVKENFPHGGRTAERPTKWAQHLECQVGPTSKRKPS
jgi:hypothetical protein